MAEILVLDDVEDVGMMIRRILTRGGHRVHIYCDEEPALEHVRKETVHIAILDIKLKKTSGIEVLEELKKIDPKIRVMMLTGYPTLETARESFMLGADEYCIKPLDMDELEKKTSQMLARME